MIQQYPQVPLTPTYSNIIQYSNSICHYTQCNISNIGGLNFFNIYPEIPSVNSVVYNSTIGVLKDNSISQVFKANSETLTSLRLQLHYKFANELTIDTFNDYSDTDELQNVWVCSNTSQVNAELTTVCKEGTYGMGIKTDKNGEGHTVTKTYETPIDISNKDRVVFWWKQTQQQKDIYYRLQFEDVNGEIIEHNITIEDVNTWEYKEYYLTDFDTISWGNFDYTNIKKVILYCYDADKLGYAYIDNIYFTAPQSFGDNVNIEIYHFIGNDINNPTLNLNTDFEKVSNDLGQDRVSIRVDKLLPYLYHINMPFGISNKDNKLIKDDYYLIKITAIDDDIIYVSCGQYENSSPYQYNCYHSIENSMNVIENVSMFFLTYATYNINLNKISIICNDIPKDTIFRLGIIREGVLTNILLSDVKLYNNDRYELDIDNIEVNIDDILLFYIAHDNLSNLSEVSIGIKGGYNL